MNVRVYAVALVAFALLYLWLSAFLVWALIITLLLMSAELAVEVAWYGSANRRAAPGPGSPEARAERRSEAEKLNLGDELITAIFIGVTWGIFSQLPANPAPWVGAGLFYHLGMTSGSATAELAETGALLAGLIVLTAGLWYSRARRYGVYRAEHYRSIIVGHAAIPPTSPDGVPAGPETCRFSDAYQFVMGPGAPPPRVLPFVHSGTILEVTLNGRTESLPRVFPICTPHRTVFVRLELYVGELPVR